MSKPRLDRNDLQSKKEKTRRARQALKEMQQAQGLVSQPRIQIPNSMSSLKTVEEERETREAAAVEQTRIIREQLPLLLSRLARIKDPRNPRKLKHKLTVLLLYGILTFVYQRTSRREANRTMTKPQFMENLHLMFPELETIPHHDTINRLLAEIEVDDIEAAQIAVVRRLIRNKKFYRYLIANSYPIAVDGSQKLVRDDQWCVESLQREIKTSEDTANQHYVYVLEANLAFRNGMSIPLMTEILTYHDGNVENAKQDCEQRAFHRLADRLKEAFSHLPIMVLLDGLYPNGPIVALLRKKNWDFMIVLQDKSLPSVHQEVEGLKKIVTGNHCDRKWNKRNQHFWWINDIDYRYGDNNRHRQKLHVVVCEETWDEVDPSSGEIVTKATRHEWISGKPLNERNVHERCNLGARHRWSGIEASFNVEKHQGYQYEHLFSQDWKAMKGYHYLMRLGHLFNVLAQYAGSLAEMVRVHGVQGLIKFVVETIASPWLIPRTVLERLSAPFQLKFSR
jgi:hypothetical protein